MEVLCVLRIKSATVFLKGKARQGFFVHKGMAGRMPLEALGEVSSKAFLTAPFLKFTYDPPMPAANLQPVHKVVGPMALPCSFMMSIGGGSTALGFALE